MAKKSPGKMILVGPAVETLLRQRRDSPWPHIILDHPDFSLQAENRQKLYEKLTVYFETLQDPTIEASAAVETRVVTEKLLAEIYDLLSLFLELDPYHRRLVLYLPFELLPHQDWKPPSKMLRDSSIRFAEAYMGCWRELLEEVDVRANFVDGNILEPELAPNGQPRVVKAAHLIPKLLEKGMIKNTEVLLLMDTSKDLILQKSVAETFPRDQSEKIARIPEEICGVTWLDQLPSEIASEVRKLDMREAKDYSSGMPPARVAWERKNSEEILISTYAERIARSITTDAFPFEMVLPLLFTEGKVLLLATIRGLRIAVEQLLMTNREKAIQICEAFFSTIRANKVETVAIIDELETLISYWVHFDLLNEKIFEDFGFHRPNLEPTFSPDDQFVEEVGEFSESVNAIVKDREVSRLIYPMAMFFGSRLKGYARRNADLDVAVFVRPGVLFGDRDKIRSFLARAFANEKVGGKVVEFWLEEETKTSLKVRDFLNPDVFLADSTWIHLLLSSVWLGDEETVKELYRKLLPNFLYSNGRTYEGEDIRGLWLEEMEREVLQYRLMHKGYRRFFPAVGNPMKGVPDLDPESVFWDPGYRRLATKLFVARVFLPRLEKLEKINK